MAVASVQALPYAQSWLFRSAAFDTNHSGMRLNSRIVDDFVPNYIAALNGPPVFRTPEHRSRRTPANRRQESAAPGVQYLQSVAGIAHPRRSDHTHSRRR